MSNRLYVTGEVACTLTQVRELAPAEVPLELVDASKKIWLLGTNLIVEQGATLVVDGSSRGDAAELRLKSENRGGADAFVELRAEWGTLTFRKTKVTSWDPDKDGPDTEYDTYGRAFVRALSFLEGDVARESRMDVIDSDIGYLGYYAAESYGLVWKVRGETEEVFANVDVFGDITNSVVHHNYFGMYSFGAYGMRIADSEFHDNVMYGVDPHDDSDSLVVEDNYIHDNGNHGFICSKRCDNLVVRNNVSSDNATIGFMFHRDVTDSLMEGNVAERNGDAGYAIMDSHQNTIRHNEARDNKYGIRLSVGASENVLESNVIEGSTLYAIYLYQGSDAPTRNDGRPADNQFVRNQVTGNATGVRAGDSVGNTFVANVFADNGAQAVYLSNTEANVFQANDFGGAYVYAHGVATDEVADSEETAVQFGSVDAELTVTHSEGRVFDTSAGLATWVDQQGSTITLSRAVSTQVMTIEASDLGVRPIDGDLSVSVDTWQLWTRSWRTEPGTATTATFVVGGLTPDTRYALWVDGTRVRAHRADANGQVTFDADVEDAHSFELVSTRMIRPPSYSFGSSMPTPSLPAGFGVGR